MCGQVLVPNLTTNSHTVPDLSQVKVTKSLGEISRMPQLAGHIGRSGGTFLASGLDVVELSASHSRRYTTVSPNIH